MIRYSGYPCSAVRDWNVYKDKGKKDFKQWRWSSSEELEHTKADRIRNATTEFNEKSLDKEVLRYKVDWEERLTKMDDNCKSTTACWYKPKEHCSEGHPQKHQWNGTDLNH